MRTLLLQRQAERSARQRFTCTTRLDQQSNAKDRNPRVLVRAFQPYTELWNGNAIALKARGEIQFSRTLGILWYVSHCVN